MAIWPALLLAPLLLLAEQSIAYALTPALCATQQGAWLHLVAAVFFVASLALTAVAAVAIGRSAGERRFMAQVATGVGALSSLTLVALWIPQWVLHPCLW